MITFDIVRVNKSEYINRYYTDIALGYIKHTIYRETKDLLITIKRPPPPS